MIIGATLLLFDASGNMMFVQTRGNAFLIHPGGKLDDQTPEVALQREIYEELGCVLREIMPLAVVEGVTIAGIPLRLHLFLGELAGDPQPRGEVDAIYWLSRTEATTTWAAWMTPITRDKIFPLLALRGLW